jgi:small subunit ribosomal protein S6
MILTPETVIELERTLKVSEEVLRHIVKRRDPKTVQKEREARAAAAAAAATAAATPAPNADTESRDELVSPGGEGEAVEAVNEGEAPTALSAEEIENVPPAIEDVPPAIEEEEHIEA